MTDVNYQYGRYSINYHGFEDSSIISEPWLDTPRHQAESSTSLEDLFAQFSEETRLRIEKLERMEALNQLHEEMKTNLAELFRLKLVPNESTNAMNRETQEDDWELFEDDSLREEETQELVSEEFQEDVNESQSLEIPIVVPPPVEKDHIYVDPMWPATPPPSRASFFHANQAHMPAPSRVEQMSRKPPNLAKLEGVTKIKTRTLYCMTRTMGESHSLMSRLDIGIIEPKDATYGGEPRPNPSLYHLARCIIANHTRMRDCLASPELEINANLDDLA
ncbi:hypothetical protein L484_008653 [Morus notabilis]|uniref:Uncharacterized protein n=1 Tax=Morus notabilis TaxID=981085 RepID=W9RM56_9ROSA|nr:hypothetical protein L484_008653 [Morus notabilis]